MRNTQVLDTLSGLAGFVAKWLLRVLALPLALASIICAIYFIQKRRGSNSAAQDAASNVMAVIFFIYPTILKLGFAAFKCRPISPGSSALDDDDTVFCEDPSVVAIQTLSSTNVYGII